MGLVLGNAEVCQLDLSISIVKNILRLEIPIYHIIGMNILKPQNDLSSVELSLLFWEMAFPLNVEKQVSPINIVHYDIETVGCLEGVVHFQDKVMIQRHQDLTLAFGWLREAHIHHHWLFYAFHREKLLSYYVLHKKNFCESALTNEVDHHPVFIVHVFRPFWEIILLTALFMLLF